MSCSRALDIYNKFEYSYHIYNIYYVSSNTA